MRSPLVLTSFLVFFSATSAVASPSSSAQTAKNKSFRSDPYKILHLPSKDVTQKEIQRQYRKLCLLHHPDKKRGGSNNSENTRNNDKGTDDEEEDFAFKEIQHAYSLIGTEEARKDYERKQYLESFYNNRHGMSGNTNANNVFGQTSSHMFGTRPSTVYFTFGGNGMTFQFADGGAGIFNPRRNFSSAKYNPFFGPDARYSQFRQRDTNNSGVSGDVVPPKRPHYIQKVTIPLEVLYAGEEKYEVPLKTSILHQYKAAFQGGVLGPVLLQGAMTILLTWVRSQQINWALSIFLLGIIVHANIPPPPIKSKYSLNVRRGWKSGTKIKYSAKEEGEGSSADVTFVVQEGKHDTYTRVGNDLHVNVRVRKRRLKKGCRVSLAPLCSDSDPIKLKLRPGEIEHDGQVVTMKGRGWPCGDNEYGDLLVTVQIV